MAELEMVDAVNGETHDELRQKLGKAKDRLAWLSLKREELRSELQRIENKWYDQHAVVLDLRDRYFDTV